jgi:hypothetical protein
MTVVTLNIRRSTAAGGAILALLLIAASAAWACTSSKGPLVHDLYNDRSPVGTTVAVSGEGWTTLSPVLISWRPATGSTQELVTATTDERGAFTASVVIPPADLGIHLVSVTQGSTARSTPFEVTPAAGEAFDADRSQATRLLEQPSADGGRAEGRGLLLGLTGAVLVVGTAASLVVLHAERSRRRASIR